MTSGQTGGKLAPLALLNPPPQVSVICQQTVCICLRNRAKTDYKIVQHLEKMLALAPSFAHNKPAMKCLGSAISMAFCHKWEGNVPIENLLRELAGVGWGRDFFFEKRTCHVLS